MFPAGTGDGSPRCFQLIRVLLDFTDQRTWNPSCFEEEKRVMTDLVTMLQAPLPQDASEYKGMSVSSRIRLIPFLVRLLTAHP